MFTRLAHVCIHAADLAATERFYCAGLGLERGFDFVRQGAAFGFYLKLGEDSFIEVFHGDAAAAPGAIQHFCIETPDIDAVIARLQEQDIPVTAKQLGADHSWQCWITDPDGVRIEIHQYTGQSLQRQGGTCVVDW